jgi:hypothetical protein
VVQAALEVQEVLRAVVHLEEKVPEALQERA